MHFLSIYCFLIVNTIGSVDDLIENYQRINDKLKQLSTQLYQLYLNNKFDKFVFLKDFCNIKTGKLNADAAVINGAYPFFTCGQNDLLINDYTFDCKAIIIAGNGEINCKFYEGKFNAYQRTYVLEPNQYFYLFLKQCELNIDDLKNNSQGSVIKFITKPMLEKISIPINEQANSINIKLEIIYKNILKNNSMINKLKEIKSKLLEKYF